MSQSRAVNAFRSRLAALGYSGTVIRRLDRDAACGVRYGLLTSVQYRIETVEPLSGQRITFVCTESDMNDLLKRKGRKNHE